MSIRPISKELQDKAAKELNEDPKRVKDDIQHIKNWLSKQPQLTARTDDQWILSFLRGCKFSLERTKEKLDMYYTVRTISPEYFGKRDPFDPAIQEILRLGLILPLRKTKGPDSPRVILGRVGGQDPRKFKVENMMKINTMITDILINEDDNYIIGGVVMMQDLKGITMAHVTAMSPTVAKKTSTIFQEAMPTRPKQLHYLNIPSFFDTIFSMVKPLIKDKIQRRMIFHTRNDIEELYQYIPKDVLPVEYGGTDGTIEELTDYWKKKVESYSDWFMDDQKYRTDESKRLGKPKTENEIFGIEGSFRQLSVD